MEKKYYITITGIDHYGGQEMFRPGMQVILKKDYRNCFDDEAIAVCTEKECHCGYVANSVHTVARGTFSAGRLYDKFMDEAAAAVMFILPDAVIAEVHIHNKEG